MILLSGAISAIADEPPKSAAAPAGSVVTHKHKVVAPHEDKSEKLPPDTTGHKRVGKASVYAKRFAGHKMADGSSMQPAGG
jgi:rare lipoprotein A (peptidoglycan hydrolase)